MSLKEFFEAESPIKKLIRQYEAVLEYHLSQCPGQGDTCTFCEFVKGQLKRVEELLDKL